QLGQHNHHLTLPSFPTRRSSDLTTASFAADITVASLTVNSATTATATLNIDPVAAAGTRDVTLTTGAEVATLNNGFTVTARTPILETETSKTEQLGQQNLRVNLT